MRFYINGVLYTEEEGYFRVIKNTNNNDKNYFMIEWVYSEFRGGFDLKPTWNYVAVYETSKESLINLYKIENALNALILINPDLLRTNFDYAKEKEKELIPYIVAQINKGNLTFPQVAKLYPDLEKELKQGIVNRVGRNDILLNTLNVLLMLNPVLLNSHTDDVAFTFDINNMEVLYDYIDQQISLGIIDDDVFKGRFFNLFPERRPELKDAIDEVNKIAYQTLFNIITNITTELTKEEEQNIIESSKAELLDRLSLETKECLYRYIPPREVIPFIRTKLMLQMRKIKEQIEESDVNQM